MKRYKLMIPGPTELEPEILAELSKPLVAHYGREWTDFYKDTVQLMKKVMLAQRAELYLMVGPGSAALDAAIGSTIADGKKVIIASNGFFGQRLVEIVSSYTSPQNLRVVEAPLGEAINPQQVEEALRQEKDVKVVALVHCETSTGVLNPLREIAEICQRQGAILIVDAISSLGGAELRFDDWGIGICVTATQKCLGVPPGLAPIAISPQAQELIERTKGPGWYLNLHTWKRYTEEWGDWHPHPVTIPSMLVEALHLSLEKILNEGLEACWERHARISRIFRQGLRNLGFRILASERSASPTVTASWGQEILPPDELIRYLKERHNILISGGIEELRGKIFRVGHMGPTANLEAILPLLLGIEEVLRAAGVKIASGKSLQGLDLEV